MASPFFSIVIPTYNRAHLIEKAVNSVLKQTFKDWELIIVDDGSTDNTMQVISDFLASDKRIKYFYQENQERSIARNNGIEKATGKYVCFLDSDDYYLENRLLNIKANINKNDVQFLFTDIVFKDSTRSFTKYAVDFCEKNVFNNIVLSLIGTPQVCIKRNILHEFKFNPNLIVGEDLELWLRIATKHPIFYLKNEPSVIALEHNERTVNYSSFNSGKFQLRTFKLILAPSHSGDKISISIKREMISDTYFNIFKYYFYVNKRIDCLYYVSRSILANIFSRQLKYRINILVRLMITKRISNLKYLLEHE